MVSGVSVHPGSEDILQQDSSYGGAQEAEKGSMGPQVTCFSLPGLPTFKWVFTPQLTPPEGPHRQDRAGPHLPHK